MINKQPMGDFTVKFSYDREPTEEEQKKIAGEKNLKKKQELIKLYTRGYSLYHGNYPNEYGAGLFDYIRKELSDIKGAKFGVIVKGHHSVIEI